MRFRRLRTVSLALTLALLSLLIAVRMHRRKAATLLVRPPDITLPADGRLHTALHLGLSNGALLTPQDVTVTAGAYKITQQGKSLSLDLPSPVNPVNTIFTIHYAGRATNVSARFILDPLDSFSDGTPDFMRLHSAADRLAFRSWFTALADAAAALPPSRLPGEIDDCAALLRWSYRNALHAHDEAWQLAEPFNFLPPLPSIQQYTYPDTPLGVGLFRVRAGAYSSRDPASKAFAQFADARTLMQRNTYLLTRDIRRARLGDLLFFRQLEQNSIFHSMILTGVGHSWAVYDTGPIHSRAGTSRGEVRRIAIEDLLQHPDRRWRPLPENSNFLGVYRWNILHEDAQ